MNTDNIPTRTKTVCVAILRGTYGEDLVEVKRLGKASRFPGRFTTAGGGYAGRIAYGEQAKAMAILERDARFDRWMQPD